MILKIFPILLLAFFSFKAEAATPLLIINMKNQPDTLPKNFRQDTALKMSGSGQFSENALKTVLKTLGHKEDLLIIDLRQEWHGFLNGIAVSWYSPKDWGNMGKPCQQIRQEEASNLQKILKHKYVTLHQVIEKNRTNGAIEKSLPEKIPVYSSMTEGRLVGKVNAQYARICVTDHLKPCPEAVQKFLDLVKHLKPGTWIHFHCAAGDGRTTTFMCLYDMLHNAKKDSFEQIIKRQWKLGGIDLADLPEPTSWKYKPASERLKFLEEFYHKVKNQLGS